MIVEFFLHRPVLTIVCAVVTILGGLAAIPSLGVSQYPQLSPPQVMVSANYLGASAEVVESAITTPLEQQINGVEGVRYITSTSSNDGTSNITVVFNQDRNLDSAAIDVQNRVFTAIARLPAEVNPKGPPVGKMIQRVARRQSYRCRPPPEEPPRDPPPDDERPPPPPEKERLLPPPE